MAPVKKRHNIPEGPGIRRIAVAGFKSIAKEQSIEFGPLTVLAGANSSGKSAIMQPLLLLKQTLEAIHDPGALRLEGPNVRFTETGQLLSRTARGSGTNRFTVEIELSDSSGIRLTYVKQRAPGFTIEEQRTTENGETTVLPDPENGSEAPGAKGGSVRAIRKLCFLDYEVDPGPKAGNRRNIVESPVGSLFSGHFTNILHLPGLRGSPQRSYPVAATHSGYPGLFTDYMASVLAEWVRLNEDDKVELLGEQLAKLGLTCKATARTINDTEVEIQVARLSAPAKGRNGDYVNLADVGLGVSQALPILIAISVASPSHLIYVEQPELHLHPRAQMGLAGILLDAAQRGVRLVVETHSRQFLLGLQNHVLQKGAGDLVKLHWFTRDSKGITKVTSGELDQYGRFGDWPMDFDEIQMDAEVEYLNKLDEIAARQGIDARAEG